jgi:hypothetical protein
MVAVCVTVGESVTVGLGVSVPVTGVISPITSGLPLGCKIRKITTAARVMKRAKMPKAAGKLRVISGSRLAFISLDFCFSSTESSSVPHTRHRFAFSFNRVPQTGQSFFFEVFDSGLIIIRE